MRVGERFQGREGFRGHQHQSTGRVQSLRGVQKGMPIHIRQKPRLHWRVGSPVGQGLGRDEWAEVGTADSDRQYMPKTRAS